MSLDPELLRLMPADPGVHETPIDWAGARRAAKDVEARLADCGPATPVRAVEQHRIDGHEDGVEVRVYRPEADPVMTLIYFHGGGWVLGDLDTADHTARRICRRLGALVVSCTYRLAPEHTFPAAHDDALAAAEWVLAQVEALGGDRKRVVIAGDSAGGNLAAAVTIALRDAGRRAAGGNAPLPVFCAQLLLYPGVDVRDSARQTPSFRADRDPLTSSAMMGECIAAYVEEGERADWRASPLAAADLSHLPPALIVVLGVDPLRDQGVAYAARLREAGVVCELIEFSHLTHGFCHIGPLVPAAGVAFDEVLTRFEQFVNTGNGAIQ